MKIYAYTMVVRKSSGDLFHTLNHCHVSNETEARGHAHEHFDEHYKKDSATMASLLIRHIPTSVPTTTASETDSEHAIDSTRVKSQFQLRNHLGV